MTNSTATPASEITMEALLEQYPGAQRALFSRYHIGGCQSCGFRPDETLGQVCERNGQLPIDEVFSHIEESHAHDLEHQISPAQLKTQLDGDPKSLLVLDVRTREEFESVAIPGARLFTRELLDEVFSRFPKDHAIVIYDHQGTRNSMDAAAYLTGHGFTHVKALRGGIDAYSVEADSSISRYRIEMDD